MKILRLILYRTFGLESYLKIISKVYITLIRLGAFKKKYAELHFLSKLIREGQTCIDIGANLGYYSYFLCKLVGKNGKVLAVEPVPVFSEVLLKNIPARCKQRFKLLPYALGMENKSILMGMPVVEGIIHHGMTHVISEDERPRIEKTFSVEMKRPDMLFSNLQALHYIKCDVEGYEYWVFSSMTEILSLFKPVVQCELGSENKQRTIELFCNLGYEIFILSGNKLIKQNIQQVINYPNDVYFIHPGTNNYLSN